MKQPSDSGDAGAAVSGGGAALISAGPAAALPVASPGAGASVFPPRRWACPGSYAEVRGEFQSTELDEQRLKPSPGSSKAVPRTQSQDWADHHPGPGKELLLCTWRLAPPSR